MKKELLEQYKETVLNVYSKEQLNNCPYDYVLVFKNQEETVIDNVLLINYQDFFQKKYLKLNIPAIRKPLKLLTYQNGIDILKRIHYGTLAITNEFPYCIGLTHFIVDGHIYFHTGYNGYKVNGLNKPACYHVIEDLGINGSLATQNYQSVLIYGKIKEVKENKEALINALLTQITPQHNKTLNKQAIEHTLIFEITIEHMDVKRHYH